MALRDITDPEAIRRAMEEFDLLGREAFLTRYGFGGARSYFLLHDGKRYDSKPILGAAHGYQHPSIGPLPHTDFSGGELATVRHLRGLGFTVEGMVMPLCSGDGPEVGRNPPWIRAELILVLDTYVQWHGNPPGNTSSAITELSGSLAVLRQQLGGGGGTTLRNANGVYMKLMNFRRFDPRFQAEGKVGLTRGNRLEQVVWDEFADDPDALRRAAQDILANLPASNVFIELATGRAALMSPPSASAVDEVTAALPPERREYVRELVLRNRKHVRDLKELYGGRCQVSGKMALGGMAGDITEAHHIEWLTRGGLDTKGNMVVLAPDVHAAIHATDAKFDWADLAFVVNGQRLPLKLNSHLVARIPRRP